MAVNTLYKTQDLKFKVCKLLILVLSNSLSVMYIIICYCDVTPGGALGYILGGYVLPGTPNWHPVLKKICPETDTLF